MDLLERASGLATSRPQLSDIIVKLRISYLADHPEALAELERLFQTEWANYYGPAGPGNARADLLAYSNRKRLPIGMVAFMGPEPCGVAALKVDSISTHAHLTPWLGAGMVSPRFRRRGIGAGLLTALENVARDLGFTAVYSGTSTASSLLTRQGWQLLEVVDYHAELVCIFKKTL